MGHATDPPPFGAWLLSRRRSIVYLFTFHQNCNFFFFMNIVIFFGVKDLKKI